MNNNQKAFIAMGLMVVLAFVVVGASSFATPVSALKPIGVPPSTPPGAATGSCASAEPHLEKDECVKPTYRGP